MNLFSLTALAFIAAGVEYNGKRPRMRRGFGLVRGASTKRGHNHRGVQLKREWSRKRAMTPLFPPQEGNRRPEFSAIPPQWSTENVPTQTENYLNAA